MVTRWTFGRHSIDQVLEDHTVSEKRERVAVPADSGIGEVHMAYGDSYDSESEDTHSSGQHSLAEDAEPRAAAATPPPRINDPLEGINMDTWDDPLHESSEDSIKLGTSTTSWQCTNAH